VVAALFRTGKVKVLAQRIEERGARVEPQIACLAVDFERNVEALLEGVRIGRLRVCAWDYAYHGRNRASDQDPSPRDSQFDGF
jgi:hypothetical protein